MQRSKDYPCQDKNAPMRSLLIILTLASILVSCKKDTTSGNAVELYVLQNHTRVQGKCQIDPASVTLQGLPTIGNDDFIKYSRLNYEFTLNDNAYQKVKAFNDWTPFAVTVDGTVIYYGYFKPPISSSSCDNSITMDIPFSSEKKIGLHLGYPGGTGTGIDDQRNNELLLAALRKQGKLR